MILAFCDILKLVLWNILSVWRMCGNKYKEHIVWEVCVWRAKVFPVHVQCVLNGCKCVKNVFFTVCDACFGVCGVGVWVCVCVCGVCVCGVCVVCVVFVRALCVGVHAKVFPVHCAVCF